MVTLAKLTASIILLCILALLALGLFTFGRQLAHDLHTYRQYKTVTCKQFLQGIAGNDAALTASYVALFDAPGANVIIRLADADLLNYPATFKQVLQTCANQPAFTLRQAMISAAQTSINQRVKAVLSGSMSYDKPMVPPAQPVSATQPQTTSPTANAK